MTVVRELVTLLRFKTTGQVQLERFARLADTMQAKMKPLDKMMDMQAKMEPMQKFLAMQEKLAKVEIMKNKALLFQGMTDSEREQAVAKRIDGIEKYYKALSHGNANEIKENLKLVQSQRDEAKKEAFDNAALKRLRELQRERKELLAETNAYERKEMRENTKLHNLAIRDIKARQKEQEMTFRAEQKITEQLQEAQRQRQLQHIRTLQAGYSRVSTIARRITVGGSGIATISFVTAYREYKKYQENLEKGTVIKTSLSPEAIKGFKVFDKAFQGSKKNVLELRNVLITKLLPVLTDILNRFNAWYQANKEIIHSEFLTWLKRAFVAIAALKTVTTTLQIVNVFTSITQALTLMGVAATATNTSVGIMAGGMLRLMAPIGLIVGAIGLLINDFKVFREGGDSAIGRLIDQFKTLDDKITEAAKKLGDLKKQYLGDAPLDKGQNTMVSMGKHYNTIMADKISTEEIAKKISSRTAVSTSNKNTFSTQVQVGDIVIDKVYGGDTAQLKESMQALKHDITTSLENKIIEQIEANQQAAMGLALHNIGYNR